MKITLELAQAIVNYLQSKPYNEVHLMIKELIQQAKVVPEEITEEKK